MIDHDWIAFISVSLPAFICLSVYVLVGLFRKKRTFELSDVNLFLMFSTTLLSFTSVVSYLLNMYGLLLHRASPGFLENLTGVKSFEFGFTGNEPFFVVSLTYAFALMLWQLIALLKKIAGR